MRILGLDEAGRGSVLGPLVVGGFCWDNEDQAPLRAAGAADSKVLSPRRRELALKALSQLGQGFARQSSAVEVDAGNLNELEIGHFVALIKETRPDRVYLDAPVHPRGIPKLCARLTAETGVRDLVVEPKADATWPVVGAASIFAKVSRDSELSCLTAIHGPIGSGYPSDPATRDHLLALIQAGTRMPPYVRTRWGTLGGLQQQALFQP